MNMDIGQENVRPSEGEGEGEGACAGPAQGVRATAP